MNNKVLLNSIKKKNNKSKKILTLIFIILLISGSIFLAYNYKKLNFKETDKIQTNEDITEVNNLVKDIYHLQNSINNTNNKIRKNIIEELEKIKNNLKESRDNINRINDINEKRKELEKILLKLRKNGINMDINVESVNTIDYNKMIEDINILKDKIINNKYKKETILNNNNYTNAENNNIIKNNNNSIKNIKQSKEKNMINANIKKINYINSLGLTDRQLEMLKNIQDDK